MKTPSDERLKPALAEELESVLYPYRTEYFQIVRDWIESGRFGVNYPALLVEMFHIAKYSCPLMAHAREQLGNNATLKPYLEKHITEETGHDNWVLDDLGHLGMDRRLVRDSTPLPETISLIGSQLYVIRYLQPVGFLGYLYVLESQPPSKEFLAYLREEFGISTQAMTFLIRHSQEDIHHRRELIDILDRCVSSPAEREAAIISAVMAHSCVNRLMARIASGDFTTCLAQDEKRSVAVRIARGVPA